MIRPLLLLLAVAAIQAADIPLLPLAKWQVVTAAGDSATLAERGGCLVVDYDLQLDTPYQHGHRSLMAASVRLLLREPLPLGPADERLIFDARGCQTHYKMPNEVYVTTLVRDANGEILRYFQTPYPHLKNRTRNWARWMTSTWYTSEAGGATQDIFAAEGGDGNAWPDGKLELIGLELQARNAKPTHLKGQLALGMLRTGAVRLPAADPFAFADGFLTEAGDYTFSVAVRDRFQGTPVTELEKRVGYDPRDLASTHQELTFPLAGDANYWIDYTIANAATGQVVATDSMRYQLEGRAAAVALPPADLTQPPPAGGLRVNPGQPSCGVYERGEPRRLTVRVFGRGAAKVFLAWRIREFAYDTEIATAEQAVDLAGKPYVDVTVDAPEQEGHDAWWFEARATDPEGRELDARRYLFGRRTDLEHGRTTRPGKLLDRDYVKQRTYNRTTYLPQRYPSSANADEALAYFERYLDDSSQMTRYVTYMVALEDFLLLDGVYDFSLLDRIMDAAADRGCAVTIRIAVHFHQGTRDFYAPTYSRQRSFDGRRIFNHDGIYGGGFAGTDPNYAGAWLGAFRALHDRYREHRAFQGYYVLEPSGENTVHDKPWEGIVAGYEQTAVVAFRQWLQEDRGLDLAAVNARWGTAYTAWEQVAPPMPSFELGTAPDLRRSWLDFCLFKQDLDADWFVKACDDIRGYDPNHVIIVYGTNTPKVIGKADYYHNGGNHRLQDEGWFMPAWRGGTGWISEPVAPHGWASYEDPTASGWVLDFTTYVMLAQAGGGGCNIHIYYCPWQNPNPQPLAQLELPVHYGRWFAYDRFEKFKPILAELHGADFLEPRKEIAALQDDYTLFCKHRTTFAPRSQDLRRWFELAKLDGLDYEDLRPANIANYKLFLPNVLDEVMSRANIDLLAERVRAGAKMVLCANTGRYCPEIDGQFPLLRALGIQPPTGAWVTTETGVAAKIAVANPLFDVGAELPFYSLAQLQDDLQSPEVRENFWHWPYRWIPQTDYFGYYRDNPGTNGSVLASFASGAPALSRHTVGDGEVIVFWGMPDYRPANYRGMMARAAAWAGAVNPRAGAAVPLTLEAQNDHLRRHYAVLWQDQPGAYRQALPQVPDGEWFVDDMVTDQKLGTWTADELRAGDLELTWVSGMSPLKILRLINARDMGSRWVGKYRQPK